MNNSLDKYNLQAPYVALVVHLVVHLNEKQQPCPAWQIFVAGRGKYSL